MGRKKKVIDGSKLVISEELNNIYNGDEWHGLFDAYNTIEAGDLPEDAKKRLLRMIEDEIANSFGKFSNGFRTEGEYILCKLKQIVNKWILGGTPVTFPFAKGKVKPMVVSNILKPQDANEIVGASFEKVMISGKYDFSASEALKYTYLKTVASSVVLDCATRAFKEQDFLLGVPVRSKGKKKAA